MFSEHPLAHIFPFIEFIAYWLQGGTLAYVLTFLVTAFTNRGKEPIISETTFTSSVVCI